MKKMANLILAYTAVSTALIAGLYYSYSCSVNPGLGELSDEGYLAAMQSINRAILNPVFFLTFMGTLIVLPLSTWLHYDGLSKRFLFLMAATIIYVVGSFGVTMFGNVPLNEALDKFNIHGASMEELHQQRQMFEASWNKLHSIRTLATIISLVLVVLSCLEREDILNPVR